VTGMKHGLLENGVLE